MAVRTLARPRGHAIQRRASVPPVALAIILVAPAIDLFAMLQPSPLLISAGLVAASAAALTLVLLWVRFPRTSWLFAAAAAAIAGLAMRLVGADIASALSLLTIVALGVGGAFRSSGVKLEAA